jgi:hypothetical protein
MGTALRTSVTALGAIAVAIALSACGGSSPQRLADQTTQALYQDNRDGVVQNFDSSLKSQVTLAQVGAISDAMHMLGGYRGLKPLQSNGDAGRYDFAASFDKGTMLVMIRMDPDGKIGAYRVSPTAETQGQTDTTPQQTAQ